jgi:hypothetical protein
MAPLPGIDTPHRLLTAERIGGSVVLRLLRGREIIMEAAVPVARAGAAAGRGGDDRAHLAGLDQAGRCPGL